MFIHGSGSMRITVSISGLPSLPPPLPLISSPIKHLSSLVSTQANIELWLRCLSFLLLLSLIATWICSPYSYSAFLSLCLASYFTFKLSAWVSLPQFDLWNSKHTQTRTPTPWKGLSEEQSCVLVAFDCGTLPSDALNLTCVLCPLSLSSFPVFSRRLFSISQSLKKT